tara:strand:+ start:447 stop:956 length:510 start_codon:yes stop_codon:yes gene_type:complete
MNSTTFKEELDCIFWYRKDKIKNVLEIGTTPDYKTIGEYEIYFNNADIYSIDNFKGERCFGNQKYFQMNPFCPESIEKIGKIKFDFIIADCSQWKSVEDQMFIAKNYHNLLEDNAVLIIKNIQNIDDCKKIISFSLRYYHFEIKELDCMFIILYKCIDRDGYNFTLEDP